MHIFDLPDELLVLCSDRIDMFAARALRSTCKRLTPMATKRLFHHLHILPTTESANKARAILGNKDLMPLVTTISMQATLDDAEAEPHAFWDVPRWREDDPEYANDAEHGIEVNGIVSPTFKAMLSDIGLFTNLRRVEVHFDWEVEGAENDLSGGHNKEWVEYRQPFLSNVFRALNHQEHPAFKVHSLSIRNLHDLSDYGLLQSDDFKAIVSRLDTLELSIATQDNEASPEGNIDFPERHRFFGKDLIDYWLVPVRENLVNLKIYCNCYWGYLPKCDLRGLHFPRLKSLAFGNMTFTHDWQLDWIIQHGETLESLILDDCPIIHDACMYHTLGHDRYVVLRDNGTPSPEWHGGKEWTYSSRWHDYFGKLAAGLPHLRHFGIGHGPWAGCVGEDNATDAFEAAAQLPAQLIAARYAYFHGGTGPSQWIEPEQAYGADPTARITDLGEAYESCWDGDDDNPPPSYPDCWDRDQEAFDELMKKVHERNGS
ncbi:hypothetical protein Q7P37_000982 [Cladosporium fusiforme]